jgi:autotransporter-associated beta strand protein
MHKIRAMMLAATSLVVAQSAMAVNYTFNVVAGGAWGTSTNWTPNGVPTLGDLADLSTLNITGVAATPTPLNLNGNQTISNIKFGDTSGSNLWSINPGTPGTSLLTLATSTTVQPKIESFNGGAHRIEATIAGTQGFEKIGAGNLDIRGVNTYTGVTTHSAATIFIRQNNGLGAEGTTADGTTLAAGTILYHLPNSTNTPAFTTTSAEYLTFNGGATLRSGGNGTVNLTGNVVLNAGMTVSTDTGSNVVFTPTSVISGAGSVTKTITGQQGSLTLAGNNTHTGGTTVHVGTATALHSNAFGTGAVNLGFGTLTSKLVLGNGVNIANSLTLATNAGAAGDGLLTVTDTAGTATWSGAINIGTVVPTAGGHFRTQNGATLNLNGAVNATVPISQVGGNVSYGGGGTYTNLSVAQGVAKVGATNGIPVGARVDLGTVAGNATLDLNGFSQTLEGLVRSSAASTSVVLNSGTGPAVLTIDSAAGSTYPGSIQNGTGGLSLVKKGGSTLVLSGASTYTGSTSVDGGTLLVNGSLGDSAVTVNTGAILGGTGGVIGVSAASVIVGNGGTLAPGSSVGTLTVNGSLTLAAGSTLNYELNGGASTADLVNVTGTLDLSGATVNWSNLGTYTPGDKFTLFAYTPGNLSGVFAAYADDSLQTFAGGQWIVNYDDTTAGLNGGTGTAFVTITAPPIPEPSMILLAAGAVPMLLKRRR